jgi:hypothetical protein
LNSLRGRFISKQPDLFYIRPPHGSTCRNNKIFKFGTPIALTVTEIGKRLHPIRNIPRQKEETKMAFYIHLGCELSGKTESTRLVDCWIHAIPLFQRLGIMETVLGL